MLRTLQTEFPERLPAPRSTSAEGTEVRRWCLVVNMLVFMVALSGSACSSSEADHRLSLDDLKQVSAGTGLEVQLPLFIPETHTPPRPRIGRINDGYTIDFVPLGEERVLTIFVLPAASTPDDFGADIDAVPVASAPGTDADVLIAGVQRSVAEQIGASLTTSLEDVTYVAS